MSGEYDPRAELMRRITPLEGRDYPTEDYREYMIHESLARRLLYVGAVPGIVRPLPQVKAALAQTTMPNERRIAYGEYMKLRQEAFVESETVLDSVIAESAIRTAPRRLGEFALGQLERLAQCLDDESRYRLQVAPDELLARHIPSRVSSQVVFEGEKPAAYEEFHYDRKQYEHHEAFYLPDTEGYETVVERDRALRAELGDYDPNPLRELIHKVSVSLR